jgi:hypothetical protein
MKASHSYRVSLLRWLLFLCSLFCEGFCFSVLSFAKASVSVLSFAKASVSLFSLLRRLLFLCSLFCIGFFISLFSLSFALFSPFRSHRLACDLNV